MGVCCAKREDITIIRKDNNKQNTVIYDTPINNNKEKQSLDKINIKLDKI